MTGKARLAVVPAYVLLCMFLGGSTQGEIQNLILQLAGLAIIAWALIVRRFRDLTLAQRQLALLAGLVVLLFVLQLLPLPPTVWSAAPGRQSLVEGYAVLGVPLPWLALSLAPYQTMATALTLIPSFAVLAGMMLLRAYSPGWLVGTILAGTGIAIVLGALQVGSTDPLNSPWYFYSRTNFGAATGFFANSNHMGALLLVAIAMLFGVLAELRSHASNPRIRPALPVLGAAGLLVLGTGVVLNGSLAVLLLGVPVTVASAALLIPKRGSLRRGLFIGGAVALAGLATAYMSPLGQRLDSPEGSSFASRQRIWSITAKVIGDHFLPGSGLGSFADVYATYQDRATVTPTITNHAHNDYLEIAMEAGFLGLLLMLAFLLWWVARARASWRAEATGHYTQAAVIASGVLLVHSLVDFPLRMPALAAIMAGCLAMMAAPKGEVRGTRDELWPACHIRI